MISRTNRSWSFARNSPAAWNFGFSRRRSGSAVWPETPGLSRRARRRTLAAIFVNNLSSDDRRDGLALHRPSMKRRVAAQGTRLRNVDRPASMEIEDGQIRVAAIEYAPRFYLHDVLRVYREQFDDAADRKLNLCARQAHRGFQAGNAESRAIELEH